MKTLLFLVKNILTLTFRRKSNIVVYIILPLISVFISLLIYSSTGTSDLVIGYVDNDNTFFSMELLDSMESLYGYTLKDVKGEDMNDLLLDNKIAAAIVIPKGYEDGIYNSSMENIQIVSIKGYETTAWLENYINLHQRNIKDLFFAANGDKESFDAMYKSHAENKLAVYDINLSDDRSKKDTTITSLGFLIMFIMLGQGFSTQMILKEKRERTYYRIASSPVKTSEFLFANIVAAMLISLIQIVLVLVFLEYVFQINTFVPANIMISILFVFSLVACGIGLVVISFSDSSYMASTLNTMILTPTCMIGGCFWPVYIMPKFMQNLSYIVPQRWALEAIEKIQKGYDYTAIVLNLFVLLMFAVVFFMIAILRLKKLKSVEKFVY
jgi:ABC-2 type transport system permease protein